MVAVHHTSSLLGPTFCWSELVCKLCSAYSYLINQVTTVPHEGINYSTKINIYFKTLY